MDTTIAVFVPMFVMLIFGRVVFGHWIDGLILLVVGGAFSICQYGIFVNVVYLETGVNALLGAGSIWLGSFIGHTGALIMLWDTLKERE